MLENNSFNALILSNEVRNAQNFRIVVSMLNVEHIKSLWFKRFKYNVMPL